MNKRSKAAQLGLSTPQSPSGTFTVLTKTEFAEIFRKRPTAGKAVPAATVPYLTAPFGLSTEEYEEWVGRLCVQPDADD